MKYLSQNFRTTLSSNEEDVIALSCGFWEAAHNELERTLLGCLRSLLWQASQLSYHGNSICKAIEHNLPFQWTPRRLCDAFDTALGTLFALNKRVFLFLDGLNECRSDVIAVLRFVPNISKRYPMLKLCVSSRPEPTLQLPLSRYSNLKMQSLNELDVSTIIRQDLLEVPEVFACLGEEGARNVDNETQDCSRS